MTSEPDIEARVEQRIAERRAQLEATIAATLTADDVSELKRIANYSRLGKMIVAMLVTLGSVGYGAVELYLKFKS